MHLGDFAAAPPQSVAIVAMGGSCNQYISACKVAGSRHVVADETWAINAMAGVIQCDRVFHMDDVAVQELRAPKNSFVKGLLRWLKTHPGPIYTSVVREGYPGLVAFPLEDVINSLGPDTVPLYMNTTTVFPLIYAIYLGVKRVSLYGMDFIYADGAKAEEGRACLEYWIGQAHARGVRTTIASQSTLLDTCKTPERRMYGYDGVDLKLIRNPDGSAKVSMTSKDTLPTAYEIERRYSHNRTAA